MDANFCQLAGLLVACPLQGGNPSDCQLHKIRLLSAQRRFAWARQLSPAELDSVIVAHQQCSCAKTGLHYFDPRPYFEERRPVPLNGSQPPTG
jgi:hypothetical protein